MKTIYLIGGPEDLTKRVIPNNTLPSFWEVTVFSFLRNTYYPTGDVDREIPCRRAQYRFWAKTPNDSGIYLYVEEE